MDGRAVNSCCVFAIEADGSTVETIEGIGTADEPHQLRQALLDRDPHPTRGRSTPPCPATSAAALGLHEDRGGDCRGLQGH